jgi:O-antigen/teichoic acid export membrane protein
MSLLKRNIFANVGGQAAAVVIGFITVPLYVKFLGTAGFGLVSFLLALQALTAILDFGLSTTANREVSRYLAQDRAEEDRRTLVRTLEVFYYGTGVVIFVMFAAAAPWLSTNWFQTTEFDARTLRTCLLIAGASIAVRWPTALYQGILRGSEQQVALNLVTTLAALVRGVGTILVLLFVTRTVVAFYWWQLVFSAIEIAVCVAAVSLGNAGFSGRGGRFEWPVLQAVWRFSTRVGGLSLLAVVLKQVDKLLISKVLPLSHLGFYNAANMGSNGITKVAQPIQTAVFPRLTQLYERQDWVGLARTFHNCCAITAFVAVPCAAVLLFFPADVLWLWTRNAELTAHASPALSILAGAMMLNSMMSVPFSLQLAAGLTMLPLVTNGIALVVMAPMIFLLTRTYGLTGAAYAWLIGNALYYIIVPPIMFRRVLKGHYQAWIIRDTLPFLAVGVGAFGAARWLVGEGNLTMKVTAATAGLLAYTVLTIGVNANLREAVLRSLPIRLTGLKAQR